MQTQPEPAPEVVADVLARNRKLEALMAEGAQKLGSVGRAQRAVANAVVRRGIGMTFQQLQDEIAEATTLLEQLAEQPTAFPGARARLVRYTGILQQVFAWLGRFASSDSREAVDVAAAAQATGASDAPDTTTRKEALERLREAEEIVPALQRLTG